MTQVTKTLKEKILAILKLDEAGRIDVFFSKLEKKIERAIQTHKSNLENFKFNINQELEKLREQLEDAQVALDDAYTRISVDNVKTNADIDIFMPEYLNRIDIAEREVQSIESQIENKAKQLEDKIKSTNDAIAILNIRLEKIK